MKIEETLKSTLKISTILILVFGGMGMLFLGYYLITISLDTEYPQIPGLILGCFFGLVGLISLLSLLILETLELDNEKLVVRSLLKFPKKTIYLQEIVSYSETEKEIKSGKLFNLTIFTQTETYTIYSDAISNYHEFKPILTKGKPRNTHLEDLWQYKKIKYFGIAFIIIGSLFLYGFWNIYNNKDKVILPEELTTMKITVTNKLEIHKSKSSRWVKIKTKEYPSFIFKLSANNFLASDAQQFVTNVRKGDIIEMDILTDTYEKKLTKSKQLTFWDKTVNYNLISVYGIRDINQSYLTLKALNIRHKSVSTSLAFWLLVLVVLGIISSGIYLLSKNSKPTAIIQQPIPQPRN